MKIAVFSNLVFLFFTYSNWRLLPGSHHFKKPVIAGGKLIFYAWGEPVYILLMLFSICLNFFFGLSTGIKFFILGLTKKVLSANPLGARRQLETFTWLLIYCTIPRGNKKPEDYRNYLPAFHLPMRTFRHLGRCLTSVTMLSSFIYYPWKRSGKLAYDCTLPRQLYFSSIAIASSSATGFPMRYP